MIDFQLIQTILIPVDRLEENNGQLEGLPGNPRYVSLERKNRLTDSIKENPQMLSVRELIVYPLPDSRKFIVVAGNQRLGALRKLKQPNAPCKVLPSDTTLETLKAITLLDNDHAGRWDFSFDGWKVQDFQKYSIEMPKFDFDEAAVKARKSSAWRSARLKNIGNEEERKKLSEPKCNMEMRMGIRWLKDFAYFSSFGTGHTGIPISEVKKSEYVLLFAEAACAVIEKVIGLHSIGSWAITTTPMRRHKDWNFAEECIKAISSKLCIKCYSRYAVAQDGDRLHPVFYTNGEIEEDNVILYDDIITTGSTVRAMRNVLSNKNVLVVTGIDNKNIATN